LEIQELLKSRKIHYVFNVGMLKEYLFDDDAHHHDAESAELADDDPEQVTLDISPAEVA